MGIAGAQQVAGSMAEDAAVDARNNGKLKAHHRAQRQYDVTANLDNVQYLNDVQEQDNQQDVLYQSLMDQWSSDDAELKKLFAKEDFAIEDAIIAMHEGSYAGTQTGGSAARLAGASARKAGMAKSRALHSKMMAVDDINRTKQTSWKQAKDKSHALHQEVAFAPVHGFRPAAPALESKKSKAGLLLGLAGSGFKAFKQGKANVAKKATMAEEGKTYNWARDADMDFDFSPYLGAE